MKKRIISIALLAVMLLGIALSCVSCGESSKVSKAVNATRELENYSADLFLDLDITAGYNAEHYKVTKEINSVILDNGERLTQEISSNYGSSAESQITYLDGKYAYLPSGMKQNMEEYEKYNTVYTSLVENLLIDMPDSLFEEDDNDYKMAKCEEYSGKLYVSVDFNNSTVSEMETFLRMYSELFTSMAQRVKLYLDCESCQKMKTECRFCSAKVLDCAACEIKRSVCKSCTIENLEYEDCRMEIEIKDGYVTRTMLKFDAYMDVGEKKENVAICGKIELHMNDFEKDVLVTLPEGADKWTLFTYDRRPSLKDLIK